MGLACWNSVFSRTIEGATVRANKGWRINAGCRNAPRSVFFPVNTRLTSRETRNALAICDVCPVKDECLASAIDNREYYGIWGGTTELQRRPLIDVAIGIRS
jgi:WhiB family redox-sensing transcriptional regulator